MDSVRGIEASWEDLRIGRTRAALDRLKQIVRAEPSALAPREALAEMYRSLGYTDQAARWGCLVDGWMRADERAMLQRMYRGLGRERVAQLVALPEGAPIPVDLEDLLFAGTHDDARLPGRVAAELDSAASLLGLVAGAVALAAAVVTMIVAVVGIGDLRLFARVCVTLVCIPAVLSGSMWFVASLIKRRWGWGLLAFVATTPFAVVFAWLAPSPGAYFPWE